MANGGRVVVIGGTAGIGKEVARFYAKRGRDVVISGRDKGKEGRVLDVDREKARVLVEHVSMIKRHTRPNPIKGQTGGIVDKEMPINASNVALLNPATGKGDRVGVRVLDDGRKVRFFKSNGEVADA